MNSVSQNPLDQLALQKVNYFFNFSSWKYKASLDSLEATKEDLFDLGQGDTLYRKLPSNFASEINTSCGSKLANPR